MVKSMSEWGFLASAPTRDAPFGMKSDFVKGRQQLLEPFSRLLQKPIIPIGMRVLDYY
jgi:hypothetical protein